MGRLLLSVMVPVMPVSGTVVEYKGVSGWLLEAVICTRPVHSFEKLGRRADGREGARPPESARKIREFHWCASLAH